MVEYVDGVIDGFWVFGVDWECIFKWVFIIEWIDGILFIDKEVLMVWGFDLKDFGV